MAVTGDPATSDPTGVLSRIDRQLGEAGRREHRFSWLTDPAGDWVVVDAYYPTNRVVLMATADPGLIRRCAELVPAHGLYLLLLEPAELEGESRDVTVVAHQRLSRAGWRPRSGADAPGADRTPGAVPPPGPSLSPTAAPTAEPTWTHRSSPTDRTRLDRREPDTLDRPERHRPRRRSGDPTAGVILVLIAVTEVVIGGGVIGLGAGDYVLGFGWLLDACARLLGTVAASQEDNPDAAWAIVVFGSPALWSREDLSSDTASLARLTAIIASLVVGLGLVLAIL